jgi:outer membrane protein OmpA-like peptidoglycan-associated protein
MKKSLLIISLLCVSFGMMAQSEQSGEVKGAHPYKLSENEEVASDFAHWSITPHFGFNAFDGDFNSEMKHNVAVPTLGLGLEYAFTPVWGIGIEYMYNMYNVTGKPGFNNADTLLYGHMHKAGAYLSMDIVNLFFPKAKRKIVSIQPYIGGGVAFYKRSKFFMDDHYLEMKSDGTLIDHNPTHDRGQTATYINSAGEVGPDHDSAYNSVGYLQAGVNVEFNLNRSLALGIRANYNYFTRDYVDGRGYSMNPKSNASKNNDGLFDVTLNLRIKFAAVSKTHVRNISSLDTWAKKEEIKPCHDTVIIKHDSIIVRETFERTQKEQENVYYVYFDNNKSTLDDKALITIQQVADRLEEDTTLYAVVTGFCDNTGSNKLNYALGDKRAGNVIDELQAEHGIASDRTYAQGLGKLIGRRSTASYGPNRRAAIRLVDKDTFERMKANLDEKRSLREEEPETTKVKTVPLTESAHKEKPNQYKQRTSEQVVTDASTTLSRLARKYYNNTFCWVYIYIANKDKIGNPNKITPGTTLTIPELTQEEMNITKDEGLVLYNNARLGK